MRPRAANIRPQAHACGESSYAESQRFERGGKQEVLLETVATATARNELILHARKVKQNPTTEQDVEVLEGNVGGMRDMQRVQ